MNVNAVDEDVPPGSLHGSCDPFAELVSDLFNEGSVMKLLVIDLSNMSLDHSKFLILIYFKVKVFSEDMRFSGSLRSHPFEGALEHVDLLFVVLSVLIDVLNLFFSLLDSVFK